MHMIDWNTYRQQVVTGVGDFAKLSPDTVRGYGAMGSAGQKTGQLDAKTRELIAIAVAITLRCDGCITVHTEAAQTAARLAGHLLAIRRPVCGRRDFHSGFRMELENLADDAKGKGTSGRNREAESTDAPVRARRNAMRQPSFGGTSRMTRECHVRMCVQQRLACSAGDKPAGARVRAS